MPSDEDSSRIIIGNSDLELVIETGRGMAPTMLHSPRSGQTYADLPYLYRIGEDWERPTLSHVNRSEKDDSTEISLEGRLGEVKIVQEFVVSRTDPYIEERLTIHNEGSETLDTSRLAMGFARSVEPSDQSSITAVPFRRALIGRTGEYQEFSVDEILINRGSYCPSWPQRESTPEMGAEGWVWDRGKTSLLIAKHSPQNIEFSTLSHEELEGRDLIRFGGASIWHGDPEEGTTLEPGSSFTFSTTRYEVVEGGVREAYYAFRRYMDSLGHGTPPAFDPPVHWNELYDNPLWWTQDNFKNREELYTLAHMEEEAAKARELGCESLYLDPGWDTSFGSSIWPPYRLLDAGKFVELMHDKFGLEVSLHMPLAVWCDSTAYPLNAHRRDRDGKMLDKLCSASPGYMETKKKRLLELAEAGFVYFMFDGTAFTGECWDPGHGHSLPLKRSEHCMSIHELARAVHEKYPDIIIELHDPMLGGVPERYAPMHYLHGLPGGFDEGWGFEYMWDPMEDILKGRAMSLYYYNLAYSLPLYLHIDLRKDNQNAMEFWWYASTCRHLGIGGRHPEDEVWEAHKNAMSRYMGLKRFFTQGVFLGYGEDVHLHLLPEGAVLNVFNFDAKSTIKEVEIPLRDLGFERIGKVNLDDWKVENDVLRLSVPIKGRDARLVEISPD